MSDLTISPPATGGGSMSIGGTVTSGTTGSVLYVSAGPVLAQDNANFFYDSANTRLRAPEIAGGTASGGTLTLYATTHATKGDINLEGLIDLYPSLTAVSATDIVHMMPTVTHTAGTTNYFRISPTTTLSGAACITRLFTCDGTWTQSGSSVFNIFTLFYSGATLTTSDTNAAPIPLVFYNQTSYDIKHNIGSVGGTQVSYTDQQGITCSTASANLTLLGQTSFSSAPVYTSSNASASLTVTTRTGFNAGDITYSATGSLTVTNNIGLGIVDLTVGTSGNRTVTNAYGIYSVMTTGTNKYFINSDGDAPSLHKGHFRIGKASSAASELQFANATNSNITAFKAGVATASVTYTLPTADGTANQVLKTNGSGTLSWTTAAGSSPLTTKGDIFCYSTVDARLPVGTDNSVLVSDSSQTTGLRWNHAISAKTSSDSASKTSDNTITSADKVAALACTLVSGKKYRISGLLMFTSASATPDAKMQFRDDGALVINEIHAVLSYSTFGTTTTAQAQNSAVSGINTDSDPIQVNTTGQAICSIIGYVDCTTGGTIDIAWAQSTSNATGVVLKAGSWIKYDEI